MESIRFCWVPVMQWKKKNERLSVINHHLTMVCKHKTSLEKYEEILIFCSQRSYQQIIRLRAYLQV